MADEFTGYPLTAAVDSDDASDGADYHAKLHNASQVADNQLQDQLTALKATVASQATSISDLQTAFAIFSAAWLGYTPTLTNVTVGTGSVYGNYMKIGRLLLFRCGFKLGSGFTMSIGNPIGISIPFAAKVVTDQPTLVTCYAQNSAVTWPSAGVGAIFASAPTRITRISGHGFLDFTPAPWDRINPETWQVGDTMSVSGVLELAST